MNELNNMLRNLLETINKSVFKFFEDIPPDLKKTVNNFKDTFFPPIPGTPIFEKSLYSRLISRARNGLLDIKKLKLIDDDTKSLLITNGRSKEVMLGYYDSRRLNFRKTVYAIYIYGYLIAAILISIVIANLAGLKNNPDFSYVQFFFQSYIGSFFQFALVSIFIALVTFIPLGRRFKNLARFFGVSVGLAYWGFKAYSLMNNPGLDLSTYLMVFVYGILWLSDEYLPDIFESAQTFWLEYSLPTLLIYDRLITILVKIDSKPNDWDEIKFRNDLMVDIERIAFILERRLPRSLKSADKVSEEWFDNISKQMASAFRSYKKWILTPKIDTRKHFYEKIKYDLVCVINNDWDSIEREEPSKTSPYTVITRIFNWIGALFIAIVPFTIFRISQQYFPFADSTVSDYISAGTLLWFLISLLTFFDPLYGSKISTIKEVSGLTFVPKRPDQ
jgi:hypothetical protein